jgi:hypothetical protein
MSGRVVRPRRRHADKACADYHDSQVRNLEAARIQVDEIWSFV